MNKEQRIRALRVIVAIVARIIRIIENYRRQNWGDGLGEKAPRTQSNPDDYDYGDEDNN